MKNNKGQALVEFVLVLPVIIMLIFGMIEFGNLIYQRYQLETHIEPVMALYKSNESELLDTYKKNNDIDISFTKSGNLVTVKLTKKIKLITPTVMTFLDNPYTVEAERIFYLNEE